MRQARPRSGADHDLTCRTRPAFAATVARREFCQRPSLRFSPTGLTVLMGNSLAEMLSTLSWLAHYGFWVNRHTLRVEFTYESRMRSLGIQALEGARMKSFLRTG